MSSAARCIFCKNLHLLQKHAGLRQPMKKAASRKFRAVASIIENVPPWSASPGVPGLSVAGSYRSHYPRFMYRTVTSPFMSEPTPFSPAAAIISSGVSRYTSGSASS